VAKGLPISDVSSETPLGGFAARVIEVRASEVAGLLVERPAAVDADAIHDLRVAIRRLRTAMEVFDGVLPRRAKAVRRDLKRVFSALGPRRDADVALEALRALEPGLVPEDRPGWDGLVAELEAAGASAGAAIETGAALLATGEAALLAARARDRDGQPAGAALRRAAGKRLAEVLDRVGALEDPRDGVALHQLRLTAKRLRYVLSAGEPALGEAAATGARVARELQTVLGDIHDCDVLLPRLRTHRRALRAADVVALSAGQPPPNAARYRGVQTVDTHVRARREALRLQVARSRAELAGQLRAFGEELAA
jgi:CHAD domain-containing protein